MIEQIEQGTTVRVRTTNGGEMIGTVASRYVTTYDLDLEETVVPIMATRIVSVEALASDRLVNGLTAAGAEALARLDPEEQALFAEILALEKEETR